MSRIFTKILFFTLIFAFIISCNSTKYVPDGENLLLENKILVNKKKEGKVGLDKFLVQKEHQTIMGKPFSLYFYNLGNVDFDKTFEEWMINHPKKSQRYDRIFSNKQTRIIYNTNKGFNNWFLNKGQAPILYDDKKTIKTMKSLKNYYISNGFFDAEVDFKSKNPKEKEIAIEYNITTNKQYYIDSLTTEIESKILDSIYQRRKENSVIKKGKPFVFSDFENEEKRLVNLFRNSGIYQFKNNSMGFWTDSIKGDYNKDVLLKIPDRVVKVDDSVYKIPYKVQNVSEINVYTDFSIKNRGKKFRDSVKYHGYNFYSYGKMNSKPKHLVNSIFITPGNYFKDAERTLTRNHLRNLKIFASVELKYSENDDKNLTTDIYLTPLKKYSVAFDLDATTSNIKPFGILGKTSVIGRNLFKGSEIVQLSFQGSFLNAVDAANKSSSFFNAWELLSSVSVKFPRILFPINTSSIIPKHMAPHTNMDISVSFQKNIGLDRQNITGGIGYTWKSSKTTGHRFDLFNLQYIKNQNTDNYFVIYDSEYQKLNDVNKDLTGKELPENNVDNFDVIMDEMDDFLADTDNQNKYPDEYDIVSDVNERYDILTEDVMVPIIAYSFVYNSRKNIDDNNFSYFTSRFVSSGALSALVAPNKNDQGQKLMFGLPIAQFFKVEFEYKKYWELKKDNILVFRGFIGAAIPYGNSSNIPFSRSYSAGGSNEIRAWRTFDLGPGGEKTNLEYNVSTFKLIGNLEYRFKVTNKIYSALFIDAGNIWDITDSNLVSEEGKLKSFSSLKNTAVGTGIGLRYNFGFLVFRFDTGFKTYEPYLPQENKWFVNYNFGNAVYNIGINYPF